MKITQNLKTTLPMAALTAAVFLTISNPANASVISIDFGDPGRGIASGDTVLAGGNGDPINADGQIFTGQVGPWNAGPHVGGSGSQSFTTTQGPVFTVNPAGSAQNSVNAATFGNNILRNDYFWQDNNVIPWELTGLTPNGTYDITFFQGGDGGGAVTTIDGVGIGTRDSEGDYDFSGVVADGSGEITGTWNTVPDVSGRASWAGLQFLDVTPAAIPEPSATVLLGLGGLALILRRRK